MVLTASNKLKLGVSAPDFTLKDTVTGKWSSLDSLKSKQATLIMFICNHCPYVKHVQQELIRIANDYMPKGVSFIAISSNDPEAYPEDAPDKMADTAISLGYPFPYLFDETQNTAVAYHAVCTPEFFLFDKDLILVYHGRLDNSSPGKSVPVTGVELREAIDSLLNNKPLSADQKPSIGCSIKWKKG